MLYYYLGLEAQLRDNNKFPGTETGLAEAREAAVHSANQVGYTIRIFGMQQGNIPVLVENVRPGSLFDSLDEKWHKR